MIFKWWNKYSFAKFHQLSWLWQFNVLDFILLTKEDNLKSNPFIKYAVASLNETCFQDDPANQLLSKWN